MVISRRLIAAAFGLVLPLTIAATADAAPRHHRASHHRAHVTTATYHAHAHKARPHHARASSHSHRRVAQNAARASLRGS